MKKFLAQLLILITLFSCEKEKFLDITLNNEFVIPVAHDWHYEKAENPLFFLASEIVEERNYNAFHYVFLTKFELQSESDIISSKIYDFSNFFSIQSRKLILSERLSSENPFLMEVYEVETRYFKVYQRTYFFKKNNTIIVLHLFNEVEKDTKLEKFREKIVNGSGFVKE
ncbi:MAG: hypothetical protein JXR63_01675 [Spirochaetales bacterium]|nr:hypothetical protein [Spirochaetales bacterium]